MLRLAYGPASDGESSARALKGWNQAWAVISGVCGFYQLRGRRHSGEPCTATTSNAASTARYSLIIMFQRANRAEARHHQIARNRQTIISTMRNTGFVSTIGGERLRRSCQPSGNIAL